MADTPPSPEPSEPSPPPAPARRSWRSHPMAKRLPLLLLVLLGLWLWQSSGTPERELTFQLTGAGWSTTQALDLQVLAEDGNVLKREERFFASGPPPEVTFKVDLPEGTWRARLFVKQEGRDNRLRLDESLVVGEERYIVRQLQLPPAGR
ncbi:hypothetical protein [Pyxidicoccus xibeiensis]|uniref:hypothetical protein n=1 Tax=Pyxidicoccus xibeiensis TaxID=2906759 RepID=UPI0020A79C39|nr:hypothetical protein [Pyxidicoccus xibeiensis]MCP3142267.1 hypothetical protein [Pyxidicoccus xibeiensis]